MSLQTVLAVVATLAAGAAAVPVAAAPARRPPARPQPSRPAPPRPGPTAGLTTVTLPTALKTQGYTPTLHGGYQRLQVEEEAYRYFVDVSLSKSGEWLVAMAHLAPIADLTKVPSGSLLNLLTRNDELLGMYFSYDRVNGRIMLNAAVPARGLDAAGLRKTLETLKETVRQTDGLWDTSTWSTR